MQLRKDARRRQVEHATVTFQEAQRIGILYDATAPEDFEAVKEYIKKVRSTYKKDLLSMGFVDKKKLPREQFPQYGMDLFTRKGLDYRMVPVDPIVRNFIDTPFDILINLHNGRIFPLRYISALSNARFRVGRYDRRSIDSNDMMVHLAGSPSLREVLEETEAFLRKLKI
ncbi:MAG: hypothetical protein RL021_1200 [Bacteroidota bacterium]|jgi:hypothetical protein